jgi:hypothetical protein
MTRNRLIVALVVLAGVLVAAAWGGSHDDLRAAKKATKQYGDVAAAQAAGYGLFKDAAGIACIANPGVGAMGVHYVNGTYVGDTVLDPAKPEAVVYEPRRNGKLKIVALEYIVFQAPWDAAHSSPPSLFGTPFMLTASPNRYGIPAFYALHAWIYKHNPSGTFAMWNPRVDCSGGSAAGNDEDDDHEGEHEHEH